MNLKKLFKKFLDKLLVKIDTHVGLHLQFASFEEQFLNLANS